MSRPTHTIKSAMASDAFTQTFGDMDENYPASEQKRRESPEQRKERKAQERADARDAESWDAHPIDRTIKGTPIQLFSIGALAKALGKKPVTIRKWIARGWLPPAQFRDQATGGMGQKRYWTREQIEAIVIVAREEDLIGVWHPDVEATRFAERVRAALKAL